MNEPNHGCTADRIARLPKWARRLLAEQDAEIQGVRLELARTRAAHSVLFLHRGWFAIPGPPDGASTPDGYYRLWYMSHSGAHPACVLAPGDTLLIGRAQSRQQQDADGAALKASAARQLAQGREPPPTPTRARPAGSRGGRMDRVAEPKGAAS